MAKKKVQKSRAIQIKIKDIKMVPVGDIVPHPQNPNIHTDKQIEDLAELIKEYGFDTALVVDKKTGFLIKGEARWRAAQHLGMATVPVSVREFKNDGEAYAAMVADNEIGRASKTNIEQVKIDMKQFKIDPNKMGFDDAGKLVDVKGHKREVGKGKGKDDGETKEPKTECPECGHKF